jgi:peptidoglycan glycosyltransferase
VVSEADTFTCKGKERVGGTLVTCHNTKGHGRIPLRIAFTQSCNIAFAKIGLRLGWDRFQEMAGRFLLDSRFDLPVQTSQPRIPQGDEMTPAMLAECSFGQGALLVTPLHLTLIAAAIANRGVIVQPRLVQQVVESDKISPTEPEIASRAIDAQTAEKVKELMVGVVEAGTGTPARIAGIKVAGKTGTAENPSGEPHSWFVGFAPADSPRVVVGVIVENAGWGATVAAPIARQLLVAALRR